MLQIVHRTLSLFVVVSFVLLAACSKSNPTPAVTETERVSTILKSKTWTVQNVTIDGVATTQFKDMTLSFTNSNYTTTKGGAVWPASGTWSFSNTTAKAFKRDDNVEVLIELISESSLTLSLQWNKTTLGTGREASTPGKHIFTFIR